ncbi:MAG: glycoside hydrolase family 37 [Clostridia bacterium]|nr:glycoside hydrolase family 37 [Clostridia bacterium]
MSDIQKYKQLIKDYSKGSYLRLMRTPMQRLSYPFIVPGVTYPYQLWDWDSWLTDVAIRQILIDNNGEGEAEYLECEKGCILNFLEHTESDGSMHILVDGNHEVTFLKEGKNIHKPCIAQHLAFILQQTDGDLGWVKDQLHKLDAFIEWYRRTSKHTPTGLYVFLDDTAIGVDNDPCLFYRPDASTASIYLNVLMYKELRAMAYIFELAGDEQKANAYDLEAAELKDAINEHLYDEKCGMYYSADVNLREIDPNRFLHCGKPRHWDSVIMRIDSWSGFMALWAGIATPERARRVIEENMLNPDTFCGKYGIRSLSKLEKMFANWPSGNPSCWLGPMWGVANYLCFRSLLNYGYEQEARALAHAILTVYGQDIEQCGEMHEYYHCDTGEPINGQGFQSWNLLVNNMIAYLDGTKTVEEF